MKDKPVARKTKKKFILPKYANDYYMQKYGKALDPKTLAAPSEAGFSTVDEQNAELEGIFNDVVREIEERQKHLDDMGKLGHNKEVENRVKNEIVERIADLQKIREMQRKAY